MRKTYILAATAALAAAALASCWQQNQPPENRALSRAPLECMADARDNARKIISQLSLKEKLAQIQSGSIYIIKNASDSIGNLNFDTLRQYYPCGMGLMNIDFGGCPPEKYARTVNSLKEYNSTLEHPVPMLFIGEGLHGLMGVDATCFPQAIALGCSWDTTLLRKIYTATRNESKARGINTLFSPILDLARDPRFGRIEEMYSEDPFLCGTYGSVAVEAFQEIKPDGMLGMASTLKHYMGHGQMEGGRNVACYPGSANDLMNNHSIPFEMCVNAGAACVMPAYNDVCDLPVTVNKWLLCDVLREQMGFGGLIISDQNAVDRMYDVNHLASSLQEAAEMAIQRGIDIDIIGSEGTFQLLEESVKSGRLPERVIDSALERLLIIKWRLGLFQKDDPVDIPALLAINQCSEHIAIAREAARKAMVLLKNDGTLPIGSNVKKIAVIGPNASTLDYGGYTAEPVTAGVSVYEGIKAYGQANGIEVTYSEGTRLSNSPIAFWQNDNQEPISEAEASRMIGEAVSVASKADMVVLCIGENVSYSREAWGESHRGDRESLELLGHQNELAERIKATGKPVVTLIFGGRPLNIRPALKYSNALAQCFYLGQQCGNAVADVLFGKFNFEGKLSVSMPSSAGALPCYYNMKPNRFRSYVHEDRGDTIFPYTYDASANKYHYQENAWEPPTTHAVFPFGYGLSYSRFQMSEPEVSADTLSSSETVKIRIQVKNISDIDGSETVQLYIRDEFCSCVRPVKELKGFQKVYLKAGESADVEFEIGKRDLMFYNQELKKVFEPGNFLVYVGSSSRDRDLQLTHFYMK